MDRARLLALAGVKAPVKTTPTIVTQTDVELDVLTEAVEFRSEMTPNMTEDDILSHMDEVKTMFTAAVRALGLTNKLQDPESKRRHRSRVMGNLNRIRARLQRIERAIDTLK
jgi:hypothetical protein